MKRFLISLLVLQMALFAAFNPLIKAQSGAKIVDIGYDTASSSIPPQYSPKIWAVVPGTYVPYEMVNMYARDFSAIEGCVSDSFGREGCPLLSQDCQRSATYSQGNSALVSTQIQQPSTCPSGAILNTTTKQCSIAAINICPTGSSYDVSTNRCESDPLCVAPGMYSASQKLCMSSSTGATCPTGYTYSAVDSICVSAPVCTDGTYNATTSRCEKPQTAFCSDSTYSYNSTMDRCEKALICSSGTNYDSTRKECVAASINVCDTINSYSYNSTNSRCEKTPPWCPTGSSYNSASKLCEAGSVCSTGFWDNVTNTCKNNISVETQIIDMLTSTGPYLGILKIFDSTGGVIRSFTDSNISAYNSYWSSNWSGSDGVKGFGAWTFYNPTMGLVWSSSSFSGAINGVWGSGFWSSGTWTTGGISGTVRINSGTAEWLDSTGSVFAKKTASGIQLVPAQKSNCLTGTSVDQITGLCVTNPSCPASIGWTPSFDGTANVCFTDVQHSCTEGVYDSLTQMCVSPTICSNGALDTTTNQCYQPKSSSCTNTGGYSLNGTICVKDPTCGSSGLLDLTKNLCTFIPTYDCSTGYSYDYSIGGCSAQPTCATNTTFNSTIDKCDGISMLACSDGFSLSGTMCYQQPTCDTGFIQNPSNIMQCIQHYSYYNYLCPSSTNAYSQQWSSPQTTGGNCLGACPSGRADGCVCNSETPPSQNCSLSEFSCSTNPQQLCVNSDGNTSAKKQMIIHSNLFSGVTTGAYGQYSDLSCGENCIYGINKIYTDNGKLCFSKPLQDGSCAEVLQCSFSGSIETAENHFITAIWTDVSNNSLSASDDTGAILQGQVTSNCQLNGAVGYQGRKDPIVAVAEDTEGIKFWNHYDAEGYLGFIETIRQVAPVDLNDGYKPEVETAWKLKADGFNRIQAAGQNTFAISQGEMDNETCAKEAEKYGFDFIAPISSLTLAGGINLYELVMNATGGNYNGSTDIKTYSASAKCPVGFYYNPDADVCTKDVAMSPISYAAQKCNDDNSNLSYLFDGTNLNIRWVTNTWNCGGTGYLDFAPVALPSGSVVKSVAITYSSSASGCYAQSGAATLSSQGQQITYVTYCPSSGAQWPTLHMQATINYSQSAMPECPDGALSRAGLVCTMPLAPQHRCVIARTDGTREDFMASYFAVKNTEGNGQHFFCSPLSCSSAHTCQYNECKEGTDSTFVAEGYPAPKPTDCVDNICDSNLPYYQWCGKNAPCPVNQPGFVNGSSGCLHMECVDSEYDSQTGKCYQWKCQDGYTASGDQCVKN